MTTPTIVFEGDKIRREVKAAGSELHAHHACGVYGIEALFLDGKDRDTLQLVAENNRKGSNERNRIKPGRLTFTLVQL